MPGHMFPLRARDGGVLERRGQTEASVDLARLAGLTPAGVICEIMREDGEMMRLDELVDFAKAHDLPIVSVEQIAQWRQKNEDKAHPVLQARNADVTLIGRSRLPTPHGEFDIAVYRDAQGLEHSALLMGTPGNATEPVLVRLHSF